MISNDKFVDRKVSISMEYIENLFNIAQNNQGLVFLIGVLATFIESFIPALPLTGIVLMNAFLLGFLGGISASLIGSCTGTFLLFILASKFRHIKYFEKIQNERTTRITNWIKKQNYVVIYLCYASPFLPSCLISIASGFSEIEYKNFVPGMVLGKLTTFSITCYVGNDIQGIIQNPERLLVIASIVIVLFFCGKLLNKKMEKHIDE